MPLKEPPFRRVPGFEHKSFLFEMADSTHPYGAVALKSFLVIALLLSLFQKFLLQRFGDVIDRSGGFPVESFPYPVMINPVAPARTVDISADQVQALINGFRLLRK
jgi:hypothetical protein